jgi:hypothetical protein
VAAAFGSEWTKQLETASTKLSPAVRDGVLQAVSKLGTAQPPPIVPGPPRPTLVVFAEDVVAMS